MKNVLSDCILPLICIPLALYLNFKIIQWIGLVPFLLISILGGVMFYNSIKDEMK